MPDGQAVLQEAVEHYGERVLSDPHLLDNFLSDVLPDDPASARLLVLTAEHDLAGSLRHLFPAVGTDEAIRVAAQRFVEAYPVDRDAALWATLAVAAALGQGTTTPAEQLSSDPAPPTEAAGPEAPATVWRPNDASERGAPPTRQQPVVEAAPTPPTAHREPGTAYQDPLYREPVPPDPPPPDPPPSPGPGYQDARYRQPIPAPGPTPWAPDTQRATKKRSPVIIAALAGIVALIMVGVAGAVIYSRHHHDRTTSPPTSATTSTTTPASTTTSSTVPKTTTTTTQTVLPVATAAAVQNATGAQQALGRYFAALNAADWQAAYAALGPDEQAKLSPAKIAQGSSGTKDSGVVIEALSTNSDGSLTATVSFQSMQPASSSPNGSTCDNWDLEYTLTPSGSSYLIDKVASVSNPPYSSC